MILAKSHAYQPRLYREAMGNKRWESFTAAHRQTDLWIAVDKRSFHPNIRNYVSDRIRHYRAILDGHIAEHPDFLTSLTPIAHPFGVHPLIAEMAEASNIAGTGPMSAVAGALAERICHDIISQFGAQEVIVENGGDIFMKLTEPATVSIYAGNSPLSEKLALTPDAAHSPLSLCCSSSTVGHALSFGTADACMVACRSGALADALATAFCNMVKTDESVQEVTQKALEMKEVMAIVIIRGNKVGVGGQLKVTLI